MAIRISGAFKRSGGVMAAISKQTRQLNFKGVKRITVKFDPFEESANTTRDFLSFISAPRVVGTNSNCVFKTEVLCNRENPSITFQFNPAVQEAEKIKSVTIDSKNLSLLELLTVTNEHITAKAPKEEPVSSIKTKSEKKGAAGAKRK